MNQKYQLDREYSIAEIIQCNLRRWWLALICAVVCAVVLGGYKYKSLEPYLEQNIYENVRQVVATLYVQTYSDESSTERANNLIRIAESNRTFEKVKEKLGCDIDYKTYQALFRMAQEETGDIVLLYLQYPIDTGDFSIAEEEDAIVFAQAVLDATAESATELNGQECFSVIDAPYASQENKKVENYFISEDDFKRGVMKGLVAGFLLGIIAEVALYSFWLVLYRKPKSAEEVCQILDVPVIDDVKTRKVSEEEVYKKVSLFLRKHMKERTNGCMRINCIPIGTVRRDVALKLAFSCANEQKKTLFIDLAIDAERKDAKNSISQYILGESGEPVPSALNGYLDTICRDMAEEKNFDVVMHEKFAAYLNEMSEKYDYIVINSPNAGASADAYAASRLCNSSFVVCTRSGVDNEMLCRLKNTADAQKITIEGVLVYEG